MVLAFSQPPETRDEEDSGQARARQAAHRHVERAAAAEAGLVAARLCDLDAELAYIAPPVSRWLRRSPDLRGPPPESGDDERVSALLDEMAELVADDG
jgi:hypothetical protein